MYFQVYKCPSGGKVKNLLHFFFISRLNYTKHLVGVSLFLERIEGIQ